MWVNNAGHNPIKNKHDTMDVNVTHDFCVNNESKSGFNVCLIISHIRKKVFEILTRGQSFCNGIFGGALQAYHQQNLIKAGIDGHDGSDITSKMS
jgi:hypothetical protein